MSSYYTYAGGAWLNALEHEIHFRKNGAFLPALKAGDNVYASGAWHEITSPNTPSTFVNYGPYDTATSRMAKGYLPRNNNPAVAMPLIIFLGGAGQSGTDIEIITEDGLPQLIVAGREYQSRIICPQLTAGAWTADIVKKCYDFAIGLWAVDLAHVYVVGVSAGALGASNFAIAYPNLVAGYIACSSPANSVASNVSTIKDIGNMWMIGLQDQVVGIGNTTNTIQALLAGNGLHAPVSQTIYSTDHSRATWNDHLLDKTMAGFDFETDFLYKYSTDKVVEATAFVSYAESKQEYLSYGDALRVVNALSAGSQKTALLARLATLYTAITPAGTRRILVAFGNNTDYPVTGNYTKITNTAGGTTTAALIDTAGTATGISFRTEYTQYPGDLPGMPGAYFGLPRNVYAQGQRVYASNDWRFQGANNAATYDLQLFTCYISESGGAHYGITATIGGVTKGSVQDVYNSMNVIRFTGVSSVSGEVIMSLNGQYPDRSNEGMLVAILLTEYT